MTVTFEPHPACNLLSTEYRASMCSPSRWRSRTHARAHATHTVSRSSRTWTNRIGQPERALRSDHTVVHAHYPSGSHPPTHRMRRCSRTWTTKLCLLRSWARSTKSPGHFPTTAPRLAADTDTDAHRHGHRQTNPPPHTHTHTHTRTHIHIS